VLPDFSASVEDKISLYHAAPTKSGFANLFASLGEKQRIIREEAPCFARYLIHHYESMGSEFRDARYGTKAYHFSMLRSEVNDTQALGTFSEPLREWATAWFDANPEQLVWEGKASSLFREMLVSGIIGPGTAYPNSNVLKLGRQLRREQQQSKKEAVFGKTYATSKASATWTITRKFVESEANE